MSDIFDLLDDETPQPPPQPEKGVSDAMATAVTEIAKSNSSLATVLAAAIVDALKAVESKTITVENQRVEVKRWIFRVERDSKGRMTTITATAQDALP